MGRVTAWIGLGANVGDADATLARAIHALAALPDAAVVGVSRLYVTVPVGVSFQPDFRNAVVSVEVPAGPDPPTGALALLAALKGIERAFGRRRRRRWGPRPIDLDLLAFGDAELAVDRPPEGLSLDDVGGQSEGVRLLVIPHPEAAERLFVLAPWADLAPDLVPPGWTETVDAARRRRAAVEGPSSVRPVAEWDGAAWRLLSGTGPEGT